MGSLVENSKIIKTYNMLHEHFFWSTMKHDVHKFYSQCFKCKKPKFRSQPNGLYTPLNVSNKSWANISMDFILGLQHTKEQ